MSKKIEKIIENVLKEFFQKLSLEMEQDTILGDGWCKIDLKTPDAALLIGRRGETLSALQHILAVIIQNQVGFDSPLKIILDVNDYRKIQEEKIAAIARRAAEKVLRYQRAEILPPMTSWERRLAHLALAEERGIVTEGVGEEPNRRVMIRPKRESS